MNTLEHIYEYLAVQELSSGDKRFLRYSTNGSYPIEFREYGVSIPASYHTNTLVHVSDKDYIHGVSFVPRGNHSHSAIYADRSRSGDVDSTIIHTRTLTDGHVGWSMLPTDIVSQYQKGADNDAKIASGLFGLARVLDIPESEAFLCVLIERYDTTIAIVSGDHVSHHRVVPVGTSSLVQRLTHLIGCDEVFARGVLEKHGLLYTHYDESIRNALLECLTPIIDAIQNVMTYRTNAPYRTESERIPVGKWVCGGIGAVSVPGISAYLTLFIDVPLYTGIHEHYQKLIQSSSIPITRQTLPKYYVLLGLTSLS